MPLPSTISLDLRLDKLSIDLGKVIPDCAESEVGLESAKGSINGRGKVSALACKMLARLDDDRYSRTAKAAALRVVPLLHL